MCWTTVRDKSIRQIDLCELARLRKNRNVRQRQNDFTRAFETAEDAVHDLETAQNISGKGELTRKRTLAGAEVVEDAGGTLIMPQVDTSVCHLGRVLCVQGLISLVRASDGTTRRCATRRLLKTLATDQRHVVAAGDMVWVRPEGAVEGIIERVEPRHGVLCRTSRQRQQVLVANVDQVLVVVSAAQPRLKPNLLDRYLITAEKASIEPIVCINKVDLVDTASLQPVVGVYSQLGYCVLLLSALTGCGLERLRQLLKDRQTAVTGQSGVGKSSLLNAMEPGLQQRVQTHHHRRADPAIPGRFCRGYAGDPAVRVVGCDSGRGCRFLS